MQMTLFENIVVMDSTKYMPAIPDAILEQPGALFTSLNIDGEKVGPLLTSLPVVPSSKYKEYT